jgi:7-carboxy-7-deazaguanine synthase
VNGTNQRLGRHANDKFLVREVFHTVQGEGPYTGHEAVFVRLAGCNLACSFCDTDFDVDSPDTIEFTAKALADLVGGYATARRTLIVVTGGEPFRFALELLMHELLQHFDHVQVETNGTMPPREPQHRMWHHDVDVVISPKVRHVSSYWRTHPGTNTYWKLIVDEEGNTIGDNTADVCRPPQRVIDAGRAYVQPLDTGGKLVALPHQKHVKHLLRYVDAGYVLSLQTHKLLDLP